MANSNNTDELLWAWVGWRNVSGKLFPDKYEEFIQLVNKAARMNGFDNNADYWISMYETETFKEDCEKLWQEIKPFYEQLHAFARKKLKEKYPHIHFPSQGHIPAHLLGNMWAQLWDNKHELLRPAPDVPGTDVTNELIKQNFTVLKIVKLAESFFTSLGLPAMPELFWEKSMFQRPSDREVVCHASAWDFYNKRDFRIKQCTEVNMDWLFVTHHEMGHVEYYLNYKEQPIPFRAGANPGFHEAIGDVMSLSVATPEHLQSIGLLPNFDDNPDGDLNFLMQQALSKIAFLPFGYLIDQWRWDVFSGKTNKSDYNRHWWNARCKYQGLFPPVPRSDQDFDPGAKYHVASNVEYIRYFVAHIIQFQIHEALCKAANNTRPLHRCDIYNSKEAGAKLKRLLEKGSSEPWPEILKELTGTEKMTATSLVNYFQPLLDWLKEQNKEEPVGWEEACPPGSFH